jgi:hypothetical protein
VHFSNHESGHSDSISQSPSYQAYAHKLPANEILTQLAPKGWIVNLGPGLQTYLVAWQPGYDWQDTLQKIQDLNHGIYIRMNEIEQVIGVSKNQEELTYLATRNASVWTLNPKLSLRQNFEAWNNQSNLDIVWASDIDFPVLSHSVLVGKLTGKDGVIDRVLKETLNTKEPLWVNHLPNIGAIHIIPGGSTEKARDK